MSDEKRVKLNRRDKRAYYAQLTRNRKKSRTTMVDGKRQVLHPTKGFRKVRVPEEIIINKDDTTIVKYFKSKFIRKFGVQANV